MQKPIPVTVLSGYLGSGKTTILNHVLNNKQGLRAAVIVNDMSELNIDAQLVERETSLSRTEEKLVELSNGCICCTLREDLLVEIQKIVDQEKFDYILIESSGISEPVPVAQTFSYADDLTGIDLSDKCRLDTMVTVVDANRFWHDFGSGESLLDRKEAVSEADEREVSDLLLDQIEFCDVLIINKSDLVTPYQLEKLKHVLKKLQPEAKVIVTSHGKVDPAMILGTGLFDLEKASNSAGWLKELQIGPENHVPETDEYGISSFVYKRREPFHTERLNEWLHQMSANIVRSKGIIWCATRNEHALLLSQAGQSVNIEPISYWVAALHEKQQKIILDENPELRNEWLPDSGDRMTQLVLIGLELDHGTITEELDRCLLTDTEYTMDWSDLHDPFEWHTETTVQN